MAIACVLSAGPIAETYEQKDARTQSLCIETSLYVRRRGGGGGGRHGARRGLLLLKKKGKSRTESRDAFIDVGLFESKRESGLV